jgi:hypothetical protein
VKRLLALVALIAATPAWAQDEPRFCVNRPSLVDTPCTVEAGHVLVEIGALDWTLDKQGRSREDTVEIGDVQARIGFAEHAELQLSWTAYGHDRQRAPSGVERADGVGDVRIGLRRNLVHPDGKGVSVALEPYVTAPVGGRAIGSGDWGYGLVVPTNFDLSDKLSFQVMGSIDAAVDEDRSGRHLSYSGDWGLGYELADNLIAVAEVQVVADADPTGHRTQSTAALSLAVQPSKRTQLDVLVGAGLNRDTPDLLLGFGGAVLF